MEEYIFTYTLTTTDLKTSETNATLTWTMNTLTSGFNQLNRSLKLSDTARKKDSKYSNMATNRKKYPMTFIFWQQQWKETTFLTCAARNELLTSMLKTLGIHHKLSPTLSKKEMKSLELSHPYSISTHLYYHSRPQSLSVEQELERLLGLSETQQSPLYSAHTSTTSKSSDRNTTEASSLTTCHSSIGTYKPRSTLPTWNGNDQLMSNTQLWEYLKEWSVGSPATNILSPNVILEQ